MAFTWIRGQQKNDTEKPDAAEEQANALSSIRLRIEDGLLMAFGPEGDPVPPALLRTACTESAVDGPTMEDGTVVDRKKLLTVIDAQQQGALADQPSDAWIEAMLGLGGDFEPTPDALLNDEPKDDLPPLPEADMVPASVASIPLTFDDAEQAAMADADALLFRGLGGDVQLSAGHYDPAIDSWILRLGDIPGLAVQRKDAKSEEVDLEVSAVMTDGQGMQRPVATKRIAFPG